MFLPNSITLKPGDSGDYVTELQRRLMQRDLLSAIDLTGFYDGNTTNAIKAFQSTNGIEADGIAGPDTLARLINLGDDENEEGGSYGSSDDDSPDEEKDRDVQEEVAYAPELQAEPELTEEQLGLGRRPNKDKIAVTDLTEEALKEQAIEHMLEQERDMENGQHEQLEVTQEYIKAETPIEALQDAPEEEKEENKYLGVDGKSEDIHKQVEFNQKSEGYLEDVELREDATPQIEESSTSLDQQAAYQEPGIASPAEQEKITPDAAYKPITVKRELSPEMQHTENQLHANVKMDTQAEGQQLYAQGVREAEMPFGTKIGELVPTQTPNLVASQQVGMQI